MARENSFSDSDGRSLTPDLDEEEQGAVPRSPTYRSPIQPRVAIAPRSPIQRNGTQRATMLPKDRFRSVVRKVMALHRTSSVLASRGVGAEPGLDPRRQSADLQYGGIKQDCVIQIYDYSGVSTSFGKMTNKEFVDLMESPSASQREPWVKVRWINIGGVSWDVIKALSLKYDLHPLALEDIFHAPGHTRSKADYYSKHLFLRILCHQLTDSETPSSAYPDIPRSSSPLPYSDDKMADDDKTVYGSMPTSRQSTMRNRKRKPYRSNAVEDLEGQLSTTSILGRLAGLQDSAAERRRKQEEEVAALQILKEGQVNVSVTPMFIFLLRDGTVISLNTKPDVDFMAPIANRLNQRDTVLRSSADPSLLVQSLLDLIVDKALEVIDAYQIKIMELERSILLKPTVKAVKKLHILSGDLILHKRTLEPIKTMVYGLRRYDLDRCAALIDSESGEKQQVIGYMSHKSKIYLADVYDHMEYILTSLEMFAGIGENLINYAFNLKSYEMNQIMRRLTLATIIFLPLTLLTGYFGMNFDPMWSVNKNSDLLFWIIALPVMAIVIPLFTFSDIKGMIHYIHKRITTKKAVKAVGR
ncbi:hypothetical protein C8J56DRAFT_916485 [Mycena floridula]|nr:hypothetical protein C8J56DRAFT_916485 [Mycena floridula]